MNENRHKGRFLIMMLVLLVGVALGVFGILKGKDYIRPYIPSFEPVDTTPVKGIVVKKLYKGTKLLLTVDTSEGALLATFTHKVDEINLLVSEGDTMEFSLLKYEPFITDPVIHRVRKDMSLSALTQEKKEKGEMNEQVTKKGADKANQPPKPINQENTQNKRVPKPSEHPVKESENKTQPPPAPIKPSNQPQSEQQHDKGATTPPHQEKTEKSVAH